MKKKTVAAAAVCLTFAAVLGLAGAAQAATDSGVHSYSCGGQFGKLSVYQLGSGNSWAPGDWSTSPQWNPTSSVYRWIYDTQNAGSGGGNWRNVTNGNYTTASPGCSPGG
ncbi:MAG: hypothetical protein ABIR17_01810 [Pseudolysinimonas sp.]|uniref:hypothetical protein n=1 Tax=Pseudolysinimonas sp. TaxID=2680009 RepID=UPI003263D7F7